MLSCPTCSSVNSKRARCYDMSSNTNTPSSIKVLPYQPISAAAKLDDRVSLRI
eukprot:TRINITY_DN262_c0_g1_i3.p3 TRINITY_DN262_c0_g1~~TRINITY_DN262_c0_g1_i3.p3  ORF type:complete len:53 (+),score=2.04 TRINITY_DN262_c0_g1_i3:47-205(+)